MKATKLASSDTERARLRGKCKTLLTRAEVIKASATWSPIPALSSDSSQRVILRGPVSERVITRREEVILLEGSKLHGFIFPPWKGDPDDALFDEGPIYTDMTELKLSDAQREIFAGWRRPHESDPVGPRSDSETDADDDLMLATAEIDLVQDITTDCSVVASLCAGTSRASKGHGTLLASIIHPYDGVHQRPRVSKNGKYMFRLHFNGCYRKVTIDDRLPASSSSRSLHVVDRRNPKLLWPALVEKAYLKVRGGYDFPGSNSGTDLWVLTGWIPEQVFLQSDDIQPRQLWQRISKSFGFGDVMLTLGTGHLTRREERELGLAGKHDYAILDMKELGPQHLLLVKNPWCDGMVWKKSISVAIQDNMASGSWTNDMRDALPQLPEAPSGTFWMTFDDVIQNFESLYLNWNPGLFRHRQDHHFSWTFPPINNPGSFTHNPQYAVRSTEGGTLWILLSRHFATGEHDIAKKGSQNAQADTSNALGFISLYVFEANGQRVYLSDDAFHRGAFVDSPQTLARLEMAPATSYTVVVAQHALPLPKYSFTLSFFSRSPVLVDTAVERMSHSTTHTGSWTTRTAGGNASAPTYPLNPQFRIAVPSTTDVVLVLDTDDKELAVQVKMVWAGGERVTDVTSRDIVGGSGEYRRGCALAELRNVAAGKYTIVCSTFEAGQTGKFTLRVGSMAACEVRPVLAETAGRLSLRLPVLVFPEGIDRMLAPLTTTRMTRLRIVARPMSLPLSSLGTRPGPGPSRSRPSLRLSLERNQGPNKTLLNASGGGGGFSDAPMGVRTADVDVSPGMSQPGGLWIVVERLGGRHGPDQVEVEILSDVAVIVDLWGTGEG
ncbi:palb protein [Phlyctema vagabunda]|uniref:Palb protein n=1 Tax=Phlyctema vagabunda TaxID=108571 RepID=A0ABR4PYK2_9HELO